MKILIVDDERSIRNSLKEILEMEEYQVDTAENGADACEMAEKVPGGHGRKRRRRL